MDVVKAKKGDAKEISNCRQKSLEKLGIKELLDNASFSAVTEDIESEDVFSLVEGDKILGTVSFGEGQISGLYVDPEFAGRGVGKILLRFIEKYAKSKKMKSIYVFSTLNARDFYLKNGYKPVKVAISCSTKVAVKFVKMIKVL